MQLPCEIVVWYIIPSIRSVLAKKLLDLGMKQREISKLLDITQPAISQYLTGKRGNEVEFNDEIIEMIHDLAIDLKERRINNSEMTPRMCEIIREIRSKGLMCDLHKERGDAIKGCQTCFNKNNKVC